MAFSLSFKSLIALCLTLSFILDFANASVITRRAVINHDAVVGIPQTIPNTTEGMAYLRYKPWLDVPHGCVPFPAVDALGNTGGGLSQNDGDHMNRCGRSTGQVYARGTWYKDTYAIMYSWYMPKDSPSIGLGHRHDWEAIIIWLSSPSSSTILGVSTSSHGEYKKYTIPNAKVNFVDNRILVKYWNILFLNHHPDVTNKKGGEQPLIAWESLSEAARTSLQTTDFGSATVPFKDSTLQENLAKAWFR